MGLVEGSLAISPLLRRTRVLPGWGQEPINGSFEIGALLPRSTVSTAKREPGGRDEIELRSLQRLNRRSQSRLVEEQIGLGRTSAIWKSRELIERDEVDVVVGVVKLSFP